MKLRNFVLIFMICTIVAHSTQATKQSTKQIIQNTAELRNAVLYIDLNLYPKGCAQALHNPCGTSCNPCCTPCGPCAPCYPPDSLRNCPTACCNDNACKECHISKSYEFTNLYDCFIKSWQKFEKIRVQYETLITELTDKYNKGSIKNVDYQEKITELYNKRNKIYEQEAISYQAFNKSVQDIEQKMIVIGKYIAKDLGVAALERLEDGRQIYVDPAYDITQMAIDQLNTEYLAGK